MNKQVNSMQEVMGARVQDVTVRGPGMLGWGLGAAGMSLYFLDQAESTVAGCHASEPRTSVREEAKG